MEDCLLNKGISALWAKKMGQLQVICPVWFVQNIALIQKFGPTVIFAAL